MAIISTLLFGDKREFGFESLKFDLLLSENHNFSNEVTEHFVENGSIISDHIQNNLENGTLFGMVTNASIREFANLDDRVKATYDALKSLWKEKQTVTIISNLEVYENVAIVDVNIEKSFNTGDSINISVTFKKINIVELKTVIGTTDIKVKDTKTKKNRQSSKPQNTGYQPTNEVELFGTTERLPNITSDTNALGR
jgi:hypothetical protein